MYFRQYQCKQKRGFLQLYYLEDTLLICLKYVLRVTWILNLVTYIKVRLYSYCVHSVQLHFTFTVTNNLCVEIRKVFSDLFPICDFLVLKYM